MRSKLRRSALILHVLVALMLLASACSSGGGGNQGQAKPDNGKPKYGGELTITRSTAITYLDPQKASGGNDPYIYYIYSAFLMEVSESGELLPSAAESWTFPDPKTILLKLRPGLKFHDGTDLDSAAVKFSIERGQDVKTNSPRRLQYAEIVKVETPDPLTLKLSLASPNASLLYILNGGAGPLLSPTAVQKYGDDFERHVISAGPYEIEKYVPESELVFKRFENYYGKDKDGNKLPYLDRIKVKFIYDPSVAAAALESGDTEVDNTVNVQHVDRLQSNRDLTVITLKDWTSHIVQPLTSRPPLDNLDLRKAIAYAIDRDEIAKSVYGGYAAPAYTALQPASWAFDKTVEGYKYDPAKAKEYLAKAGYPNGIKLKGASYRSGALADMAEAVQAQLKRVGIDMSLDIIDTVTFQKLFRAEGQFDIGFMGYSVAVDPDSTLAGQYATGGAYNPGRPKMPEGFDRLLEQGRSTYDQNERKKIYGQLERLINERVHNVFVVIQPKFMAHSNHVKGFTPGGTGTGDVRWVWIDK